VLASHKVGGIYALAVKYCEPAFTGGGTPLFPPCITRENKQPSLEDVSLTQTAIVISREHNAPNSSFLILSLLRYMGHLLTEFLSAVILFPMQCKFWSNWPCR